MIVNDLLFLFVIVIFVCKYSFICMSMLSLEKVVQLIMNSSLLLYYNNNDGNNYIGGLGHIIG